MKIRTGFVSNSSSASFMMIGLRLTDELKEILIRKAIEQSDEDGINEDSFWDIAEILELDYWEDEDDIYVGTEYARAEDDFMPTTIIPIQKLAEDEDIRHLLVTTEKTLNDLVIITGTKEC